jgi:GNAT superfamily N-acetyltransferase
MDGASPVTDDSSIEIRQIDGSRGIREWLEVPAVVFAGDSSWIAPLNLVERQRISARHNPFFTFGEAAFFVALRDGHPVGRISAQVNRRHLEHHKDATGHFGLFNAIDDRRIARALVEAAMGWLRNRGLRQMVGPFNLSVNEDIGLLISGFDTPPAILSSHARPWEGPLLEASGLRKVVDVLAYRMRPAEAPDQIARLATLARKFDRVKVRSFDMSRYAQDVATVFDIFNDAWSDNWSFVPASEAEIAALTRETRPFMKSKFGRIADVDGVPAAMIVALPDLNNVIAGFRGRLLPFNWAKLIFEIKRDRWRTARIPLLGIRKVHRGTPLAPAILALLVAEILDLGRAYNLDWVEFSWILETNRSMVALAELAAGPACKRYRMYSIPL